MGRIVSARPGGRPSEGGITRASENHANLPEEPMTQLMRHIVPGTGSHAIFLLFWPVLILCLLAGTARAAEQRPQAAPREDAPGARTRPAAWLSGVVTYRERMALPPDAVLVIRLHRRQDRQLLAELRLPVDGKNVPLPFHLAVPAAPCAEGCEVRAEIADRDGPLFASDALALPREGERDLEIMTFRVMPEKEAEAGGPAQDRDDEKLAGVRWRLLELFGEPARVFADQPEPYLIFLPESAGKGRIGGSDGCNRLLGRYERQAGAVRFLDLGATMMLCPDGMEQASAYARALHEADAWRLTGRRLELYQGDRLLAVFAEATL